VSPLLGSDVERNKPEVLAESSDELNPEVALALALFLISSGDITSMVRPEGSEGSPMLA